MAGQRGLGAPPVETRVLPGTSPASIAVAAAALRAGELVAFPTETVYGLGADAVDARAVARVFAAKERPRSREAESSARNWLQNPCPGPQAQGNPRPPGWN